MIGKDKRKIPIKIRRALKEFSQGVNEIIGEDKIEKIILYGSYARGEQDAEGEPSDIDIMILVKIHPSRIKKYQMQVLDFAYELDLKYDILLSPRVENKDIFENRLNFMPFYMNVQEDGVLING